MLFRDHFNWNYHINEPTVEKRLLITLKCCCMRAPSTGKDKTERIYEFSDPFYRLVKSFFYIFIFFLFVKLYCELYYSGIKLQKEKILERCGF